MTQAGALVGRSFFPPRSTGRRRDSRGEHLAWQPAELVAVLGEHRGRHWGMVRCLAYHPGGGLMASSGDDPTIRLWETDTMNEWAVLSGHFELAAENPGSGIARTGDGPPAQSSINMDRPAGDDLGARGDGSDDNHIAFGMRSHWPERTGLSSKREFGC